MSLLFAPDDGWGKYAIDKDLAEFCQTCGEIDRNDRPHGPGKCKPKPKTPEVPR